MDSEETPMTAEDLQAKIDAADEHFNKMLKVATVDDLDAIAWDAARNGYQERIEAVRAECERRGLVLFVDQP